MLPELPVLETPCSRTVAATSLETRMLFLLAGGKTFRFHFCAVVKNLDGLLSAVQYWLPHSDRDCISRTLISRFDWIFHVFLI